MDKIPVSIDINTMKTEDVPEIRQYAGVGIGYNFSLGTHVSIEPGIKYDMTINDKADKENNLQLNVGFILHY